MSDMSDKIRKLMALASHPGTGAAEAASAAAMAAELGLKYNIELASLADKASTRKQFAQGSAASSALPRDKGSHTMLAGAVAALYGCKHLMSVYHNSNEIMFVGQPHNVDLCNHWLRYLWQSCQRSNAAYAKGRSFDSKRERYKADQSFRLHFANEVAKRLRDKLAQMQRHGVSSTGTALVVVAWYEQERREVQAWVDQNMGKLGQTRTRSKSIDYRAALAGNAAGKQVSLADQVVAKPAAARLGSK